MDNETIHRKVTHLDNELSRLKSEIAEMGMMVRKQLSKSMEAITLVKKGLAKEVLFQERRVNAEELKIDSDCEKIMALFNPVAIDLRLVFAAFKINSHLERMGDHAKGIAAYAMQMEKPFATQLFDQLQFNKMFEVVDAMIENNMSAFENSDTTAAREIFKSDNEMDNYYSKAIVFLAEYLQHHVDEALPIINLSSVVHKLERIGDLNKNIAEEIIFYVEANVLKHEKEKI